MQSPGPALSGIPFSIPYHPIYTLINTFLFLFFYAMQEISMNKGAFDMYLTYRERVEQEISLLQTLMEELARRAKVSTRSIGL